jgi:hypothetical protein
MSVDHPVFALERYSILANSPAVLTKPELAGVDPLTRRVGSFMVFDHQGRAQAFRDDSAPRLRPDFRITNDPDGHDLLLLVEPDGAQRYRVLDASGQLLGRFVAQARPLQADCWRIESQGGVALGLLADADFRTGFWRRWRPAAAREAFLLTPKAGRPAYLMREPQALPYLLRVVTPPEFALDRRLLLAAALCLPAVAGLTDYLSGAT